LLAEREQRFVERLASTAEPLARRLSESRDREVALTEVDASGLLKAVIDV